MRPSKETGYEFLTVHLREISQQFAPGKEPHVYGVRRDTVIPADASTWVGKFSDLLPKPRPLTVLKRQ